MQKFKSTLILLLVIFLVASTTFFIGRYAKEKDKENGISAEVLLEKIQDQYFLVTKTMILDEEIEVTKKNTAGWEKFLLGDTVLTRGKARIDIGVDLNKLAKEDIQIDKQAKTININLPVAEILDSSLFGEIKVESKKGVWTNIRDFFLEDENEEYNKAIAEIVTQAETTALKQTEVFREARESSIHLVDLIVREALDGYEVLVN